MPRSIDSAALDTALAPSVPDAAGRAFVARYAVGEGPAPPPRHLLAFTVILSVAVARTLSRPG